MWPRPGQLACSIFGPWWPCSQSEIIQGLCHSSLGKRCCLSTGLWNSQRSQHREDSPAERRAEPGNYREAERKSFFFFFSGVGGCFLGLHLQHMEVPRLGVKLEPHLPACITASAMQDPSHIWDLYHSSWQCWILNPLSHDRDLTGILMGTGQFCYCCTTTGTKNACLSPGIQVHRKLHSPFKTLWQYKTIHFFFPLEGNSSVHHSHRVGAEPYDRK